jgi:hypothetical protein
LINVRSTKLHYATIKYCNATNIHPRDMRMLCNILCSTIAKEQIRAIGKVIKVYEGICGPVVMSVRLRFHSLACIPLTDELRLLHFVTRSTLYNNRHCSACGLRLPNLDTYAVPTAMNV